MEKKRSIGTLINCIAEEMERLQYSPLTIKTLRLDVQRFEMYVREKTGSDLFTEQIGAQYLKDDHGFPFDTPRPLTSREAAHIRCIRKFGKYQLYGALVENRVKGKTSTSEWALGDKTAISAYLDFVQTADNSEATKKQRLHLIRLFYEFLGFHNVNGIREISGQIFRIMP